MVVEKADKEDKDGVYRLVIPFFFFFFFNIFSQHKQNEKRNDEPSCRGRPVLVSVTR
jgi:hypothetical protein